eukprot:3884188-Pleurochrysis_carterae.AAC.2
MQNRRAKCISGAGTPRRHTRQGAAGVQEERSVHVRASKGGRSKNNKDQIAEHTHRERGKIDLRLRLVTNSARLQCTPRARLAGTKARQKGNAATTLKQSHYIRSDVLEPLR